VETIGSLARGGAPSARQRRASGLRERAGRSSQSHSSPLSLCSNMKSMRPLARVVEVSPLGALRLRLTFSDGLVRELDFDATLRGGILEEIREQDLFDQVSVDRTAGTIAWPNGVDLDPDVLHGDYEPASGPGPSLIRQYRLRPTA